MAHFRDAISGSIVLADTESLFSAFMDNLPVFAWIKDLEGRYLYVNKLLIAQLPSFQSGWLGKTDADLCPAEIAAAYRANDLKVIAGLETLETVETCLVDGQPHTLLVSKFPILDHTGAVTMVGGTGVDITAHKRAEESLRLFRGLIDRSTDAIEVIEPNSLRFLDCNASAYESLGYTREEFLSLSAFDIDPVLDQSLAARRAEEMEKSGFVIFESVHRRKDGSTFPVEINAKTIRLERDYRLAVVRDITERKRAEAALAKLAAIVESSGDAIVSKTLEGIITSWNKGAERIYGYTEKEVVGRPVSILLSPDRADEMSTILQRIRRGTPVEHYETERVTKDGRIISVSLSVSPVRNADGTLIGAAAIARDVTERKQAAKALRLAEQKYRDIFENAGEGIFQSTPEGRYISANPALASMLGFDSAEEFIRSRTDISRESYADPQRREEFKRLLEEFGMVRGFEHQGLRKDGSRIWITVNARAVRDEHGAISYYEGIAQDITERKQVEGELIRQKEILQNIVDHIPVMINFTDARGRVRLVNPEWQKTLGWSLEELRSEGLEAFSACYPDPRQRQEVSDFIAAATGEWVDFKTRTRDGRQIDTSWARVKLSDGTTLGIGQDITARKRSEQALRQAEQKYRELFENAKDAIYVHDLNGRYTSLNRAAEQLVGYSREEILGKDFRSFVVPEYQADIRENLCRKLRQEGETTYEVEVITKDLRHVPVEISSRLIYEDGVPVAVQGTARNIVERKRAEEALRGYSRQLIRAQEAERQSIARELHDQVGQVLTAIRINLETIRTSSSQLDSHALIDEGVSIVDEAIKQVRDLSFELRPSLLDDLGLNAALRWYADRYAQRTGIQTQTSICPDSRIRLPRELETACFRIVQEALTNVARHAHARRVSIDLRTTDEAVSLSIKDDGIGFNLRPRTNGASLNSFGLRGMEERARELGGKLEIQTAPHEGTEIKVRFPVEPKEKNPLAMAGAVD